VDSKQDLPSIYRWRLTPQLLLQKKYRKDHEEASTRKGISYKRVEDVLCVRFSKGNSGYHLKLEKGLRQDLLAESGVRFISEKQEYRLYLSVVEKRSSTALACVLRVCSAQRRECLLLTMSRSHARRTWKEGREDDC
jgi:hypothetical protein